MMSGDDTGPFEDLGNRVFWLLVVVAGIGFLGMLFGGGS